MMDIVESLKSIAADGDMPPRKKRIIAGNAALEIIRLRSRVNSLIGVCKTASGMLYALDDNDGANEILWLAGDIEP